jgi:hypothetical protein
MMPERRTIGEQSEEGTRLDTARVERPTPRLPAWESFASTDRQRLVRTVLDVAHRQIGTRPVDLRQGLER